MIAYVYSAISGLALAGVLLVWEARPQEAPTTSPAPVTAAIAPAPSNDREAWAVALLARLGNTQPTAETVAMVVEWTLAEDSGSGAFDRGNPLNTTMPGYSETQTINSDGVKGYESHSAGLDATVATLTNGLYNDVVAALQANDADGAKRALWASPWASSHYGYGANWPRYTIAPQKGAQHATGHAKCLPTMTGAISAHFWDTSSGYWAGQAGGMHNGTDYAGAQGEPVFAPFDLTVEDIQYYGDAGRIGWYVQGRLTDGYLFYAGHLGTVAVQVGQVVSACTQIGTIGEVNHTHIKVASPDKPAPCEATGCDNFEEYYQEH